LGQAALGCARPIARLRARFDESGAPVIYVNDNFAEWQGEFKDLVVHCATSPGPPADIARLLSPKMGHYYVLKPKHSAFLGTPLSILLAKLGVRQLVLCGISVDSCILATAQDANMREFSLWVPRDTVAAITLAQKSRGLALLRETLHADVRTTRAVADLFPARHRQK
jgi:nicotinamidase-related amidase